MLQSLLSTAVGSAEAQRSREDGPAALSSLYSPRHKAPSVAHSLDMIEDRQLGVSGQHKVAVHAMYGKVIGDGSHCGGEALGYRSPSVNTPGTGRVPKRARIREHILFASISTIHFFQGNADGRVAYRADINYRRQLQDILDGGLGGVELRRGK